jgi:hypothetical protein
MNSQQRSYRQTKIGIDIHVEELEPEMVDVQDIEAEGVKLSDEEDSCALSEEEN